MDFHKIPYDKLRDSLAEIWISKGRFKDDVTLDMLIDDVPYDDMNYPVVKSDSDESNSIPYTEEIFTDSIGDVSHTNSGVDDNSAPVNEEASDESEDIKTPPKKDKKKRKNKKGSSGENDSSESKSDGPSRAPSSFVFFKSHPDNQSLIEEASKQINEETGKPIGKVKGAGIVWKSVSVEDKKVWAQKAKDSFTQN